TQALPERGFLLGEHLPVDGLPDGHVPGAVRDSADGRVAGAVGGDVARRRSEDRAAEANLPRAQRARLRTRRGASRVKRRRQRTTKNATATTITPPIMPSAMYIESMRELCDSSAACDK